MVAVPPPCAQPAIRLVRSYVAAGNVGGAIAFVNRGSAPCSLRGWPRLVAVRRDGSRTRAVRVRSTMFGPYVRGVPVVTLRAGEAAVAAFATSDIPGPGATSCPPRYRRLRVTPPGSARGGVISAWLPALAAYLPSCARLTVTMVVPRKALR